ncbi:MAG TPA: hypothetical protein VNA20_05810 [Frankiaceae bacterium]|nr:hypothetical protein [Frankiaceae bacterium]
MDPLERALANEFTEVAGTAPGWADPAGRVRAAAHRQQQRRVVAGVVAVVAGIVIAAAVVSPAAGTRGAPVADAPAAGSETPAAEEPTPAAEPTPTAEASPTAEATTAAPKPTRAPTHAVVVTAEATPEPPSAQPTPSRNPSAMPSPSGYLHPAPMGEGMETGRWYRYDLYTHCGIEFAQFDGRHWRTERLDDGSNNPPPGWNNPYQSGIVALLDRDLAEFRGHNGKTLHFTPTDRPPPPCM